MKIRNFQLLNTNSNRKIITIIDNLWIFTTLKRNARYQFRVKSENEYGFSEYSNVSEEYDVENDRYTKIALWSILPVFCMTGIIALVVLIYGTVFYLITN